MNSNWSYSPETKSWVVTSVTLTFDLWPWPFAWTFPWSNVITPENFMMIRWWEHSQKGVTDGQTDRRTDGQTDRQTENTICRAAWSQLKIPSYLICKGNPIVEIRWFTTILCPQWDFLYWQDVIFILNQGPDCSCKTLSPPLVPFNMPNFLISIGYQPKHRKCCKVLWVEQWKSWFLAWHGIIDFSYKTCKLMT